MFRYRREAPSEIDALIRNADALRDACDYAAAANAYAAALIEAPKRADLRVQYGNMLKDSGHLVEAEDAYRIALQLRPDDFDIHLQLGHVLKLRNRLPEACAAYRMALHLNPASAEARQELLHFDDPASGSATVLAGKNLVGLLEMGQIANSLSRLEAEIALLKTVLPDRLALRAFSAGQWAELRRVFTVQPPPRTSASDEIVHVIVDTTESDAIDTHARVVALAAQSHRLFQAAVIVDSPQADTVRRYTQADSRFRIVSSLNEALGSTQGIIVLSAGNDRLDQHALSWFAYAIRLTGAHGASSDSETLQRTRWADEPDAIALRSPADPDSLLEADLIGSTLAAHADAIDGAIARNENLTTARAIREIGLELARAFRLTHVPLPLVATSCPCKLPASDYAGIVRDHLQRHGESQAVVRTPTADDGYAVLEIVRPIPENPQSISVVIPTLAEGNDVFNMVASLRATASRAARLDILVIDNGCTSAACLARLQKLQAEGSARVTRIDAPFNWSHLNNLGAEETRGDILVFANDDMRMLSHGWDDRLRMTLARETVGAIGAKLLYPRGTIQHAGILVGWPGPVTHDGQDAEGDEPGPELRYVVTRRVAAITGAFLGVRRRDFEALGGFDATRFAVSYNDVDFCFRLRRLGYGIIWSPQVVLTHHESKTRGLDAADVQKRAREEAERRALLSLWQATLARDATKNPFWLSIGRPMRYFSPPSAEEISSFIKGVGRGVDPYSLGS